MAIYLLRHGETENNRKHITQSLTDDCELTGAAKLEMMVKSTEVKSALRDNVILYVSPMLRAKETASILVKQLMCENTHINSLSINFVDDIREVDFGKFGGQHEDIVIDGTTMQQYRTLMQQAYYSGIDVQYPNGESFMQICKRANDILQRVRKTAIAQPHADIVIVGHNRIFRHILVQCGVLQPEAMFKSKLPHAELVQIPIENIVADI